MKIPPILAKSFRQGLILFGLRAICASLVIFPFWVYLNHCFSLSNLAEHYWPLPGGLALIELIWSLRDVLYFMIPLCLIVSVIYWLALQFVYGGICAYAFGDSRFDSRLFFGACARHWWGFAKISTAAVLLFLVVLLATDLIGQFISTAISSVAGKTSGKFLHGFILFLAFYATAGFVVNLRLLQIQNNTTALGPTITDYARRVLTKFRPFLGINITGGLLTAVIMLLSMLILKINYSMKYETITLLLTFFAQQATIFIWSYLEALQINLNVKLVKEPANGIDVE